MNIFETPAKMPADPSRDVVRSAIAEPHSKFEADVPGLRKMDNSVRHVPSPQIGKKV